MPNLRGHAVAHLFPDGGTDLRPYAGGAGRPGLDRVRLTAHVAGNAVAERTPVSWSTFGDGDLSAALRGGANGLRAGALAGGDETRRGSATVFIPIEQVPPHARLTAVAGRATGRFALRGGPVALRIIPVGAGSVPGALRSPGVHPHLLFFDEPEAKAFAVRVTDASGNAVEPGTLVHWHDAKGLFVHTATKTGADGWTTNEMRLSFAGFGHGFEVLGRNPFSVTVAGHTKSGVVDVTLSDPDAAATVTADRALIAGDATAPGTVRVPTTDVDPADPTREIDRTVAYETSTFVRYANLESETLYRVRIVGNAGGVVRVHGEEQFYEFTTRVDGRASILLSSGGTLGPNSGRTVDLLLQRPVYDVYGTRTGWEDVRLPPRAGETVGRPVHHRVAVTNALRVARLKQTAGVLRQTLWGAVAGSDDLDAALAGDLAVSFVPGLGAWPDVRDLGKNLLRTLPLDPGLGEPDWREAAIAGFGLAAEFMPAADWAVDAYRTLYKIAKASTAAMPFFLAVEPLFTSALKRIFVDGPPQGGAAAAGDGNVAAAGDGSAAAFAGPGRVVDLDLLRRFLRDYGVADVERLVGLVDLMLVKMVSNRDWRDASLQLMTRGGRSQELADVLMGTVDRLGADATAKLWGQGYRAAGGDLNVNGAGIAVFGRMLKDSDEYPTAALRLAPILKAGGEEEVGDALANFGLLARNIFADSLAPPTIHWGKVLETPDIADAVLNLVSYDLIPDAAKLKLLGEKLLKFDGGAAPSATAWQLIRLKNATGIRNNAAGELYQLDAAAELIHSGAVRDAIAGYPFRLPAAVGPVGRRTHKAELDFYSPGADTLYEMKKTAAAIKGEQFVYQLLREAQVGTDTITIVSGDPEELVRAAARRAIEAFYDDPRDVKKLSDILEFIEIPSSF